MMAQRIWKVFYPHSSWSLPSGVLIGVVNHEYPSVTVTHIVELECALKQLLQTIHDLNKHIKKTLDVCVYPDNESNKHQRNFQVVGLLIKEEDDALWVDHLESSLEAEIFLVMQKMSTSLQPECVSMKLRSNTSLTVNNFMFVAYDSSVEYQANGSHSIKSTTQGCLQNGKLVDHAMGCLRNWNLVSRSCDLKQFGQIQSKKGSFFRQWFNFVLMFLLWMVVCPMNMSAFLLKWIFSTKLRLIKNWIVDAAARCPATGCQLNEKYKQLQEYAALHQTKNDVNRERNLLLLLITDLVLGIVLIIFLHQMDFSNILASAFMEFANTTAKSLEELLHWLMGAPAGLKLNRGLASFLGQFFLYHIYLWVGYLGTIAPFLAVTIKFTSLCGCLSLSVLIALASDVLAILTFHIYCFYVYAARIHCLQVHGLMAFWRLFRGKKWNVLRQRVDSSAFRVDQLFLGTLLFTILLFLLPTTALFYTVFTLLRLAVLIPQSVVARIIMFMNRIPLYSLFLWTLRAGFMVDGITFHLVPRDYNQQHGWLILKMKQMSLMKVIAVNTLDDIQVKDKKSSWKSVGQDLLSGYLVYPWGGKCKDQ